VKTTHRTPQVSPLVWAGGGLALVLTSVLSLGLGSVWVPPSTVLAALLTPEATDPVAHTIVWSLRMPRVVVGMLAGAALGMSGAVLQTVFRNPLAEPYILGVSSGASLGVATVVLGAGVMGVSGGTQDPATLALAAFLGALGVLLLIGMVASRVDDLATLLVVGVMVAAIATALVAVMQLSASAERVRTLVFWAFGSLAGVSWAQVPVLALGVLGGTILLLPCLKPLDALLLGERYALSLGVRIRTVRLGVIAASALLAGTVTAFCGPIGFVGFAVPHVARAVLKTTSHRVLVPASALYGGVVLLVCDLIARVPGSASTVPLSTVTALLGAPFVIVVILRSRNVGQRL